LKKERGGGIQYLYFFPFYNSKERKRGKGTRGARLDPDQRRKIRRGGEISFFLIEGKELVWDCGRKGCVGERAWSRKGKGKAVI